MNVTNLITTDKQRLLTIPTVIAITLFTHLAGAQCVPPPAGLVAFWPGDGHSKDVVGANNATPLGGATFTPGKVGDAFALYTNGAYLEVPASPTINFGTNVPITVELWAFRKGVDSIMHLIGKRSTNCGIETTFQLAFDPAGLALNCAVHGQVTTHGTTITSWTPPINAWVHLAFTFDGSQFVLYTNGIAAVTGTGSLGLATTEPLQIGNSGGCGSFVGLLDEVSIYNRALTSNEIANAYSASWKCREPSVASIALYPGIAISGVISNIYGIQSSTDLSNTNAWVGVTNLMLATPDIIWYDSTPATTPARFYRVLQGPISIP